MQWFKPKQEPKEKIPVVLTQRGLVVRVCLVALALVIASWAFYSLFSSVLRTQPGWETISPGSAQEFGGGDFRLRFPLGADGGDPAQQWRSLNKVYPQTLGRACRIFDTHLYTDIVNLAALNRNPNKVVTVEPELYNALSLLESMDCRYLYYAPVYSLYRSIFACSNDYEASSFDPLENGEAADFVQKVTTFAADPESIRLELLGENQVCLHVSQAYMSYAQEAEIADFLDFFYLREAFVLDTVAQSLRDTGLSQGILEGNQGGILILGSQDVTMPFLDFQDGSVFPAAELNLTGPGCFIDLQTFPGTPEDSWYFVREDGEIRNPFLSENGLVQAAWGSLLLYSRNQGCAQTLLKAWDQLIAPEPDWNLLHERGLETTTIQNRTICTSSSHVSAERLAERYSMISEPLAP